MELQLTHLLEYIAAYKTIFWLLHLRGHCFSSGIGKGLGEKGTLIWDQYSRSEKVD